MGNITFTIPGFPGYTIDWSGTIREAKSNQAIAATRGGRYTYYLYNAQGERKKVGLKELYRKVFNVEYSVDNVENISGEVWRPIPGTAGKYFASSKGRIKSLCYYKARIKKPFDNGNGYMKVEICGRKRYVHSLVALAFLGEPEPGKDTVHHKNANRQDNRIENLCYLSLSDNIREAHQRKAA